MSQLDELAEEFDPEVIRRGKDYFKRGRVQFITSTPVHFETRVKGSSTYDVMISADDAGVCEYSCTCPYAEDGDIGCKHIWASLLAAEFRAWNGLRDIDIDSKFEDGEASKAEDDPKPMRTSWSNYTFLSNKTPSQPAWLQAIRSAQNSSRVYATKARPTGELWPEGREVAYVIDVAETVQMQRDLVIEVMIRERKAKRKTGKWKRARLGEWESAAAPDSDRVILQMLAGRDGIYGNESMYEIEPWNYETVLRSICESGRCFIRRVARAAFEETISWDSGEPWQFIMAVSESPGDYRLTGTMQRGEDRLDLGAAELVLRSGLLIARGKIARAEWTGGFDLMTTLRQQGELRVPTEAAGELVKELYRLPDSPRINWPASLQIEEVRVQPKFILRMTAPPKLAKQELLKAELCFDYAGTIITPPHNDTGALVDESGQRVIVRDQAAETRAQQRLPRRGFRMEFDYRGGNDLTIPRADFAHAVLELVREGWQIEGEGAIYRTAGKIEIEVSSGIDWFDLNGRVTFDKQIVALPRLLEAVERGQQWVALDDGNLGLLPEDWLKKYATLSSLGQTEGDSLRFSRAQAGFLDALIATMPEARCDETFDRARKQLAEFQGIKSTEPLASFTGDLRPYQKEGLGWLHFLNNFSFGGCLADDMGLGKTVEVLAMLEARRAAGHGASLVVVPRSLIFNWKQEAARFTPQMRVLDHSGSDRARDPAAVKDADLVLTTYGTLRRDISHLKDVEFDYAILDESQAIKNATTQAAKAARLLRARHRLAMSGTPIENRLAELWSLFEFLNPGMLGRAGAFRTLAAPTALDESGRGILAKALRPFILRRTKEQVAKDLPEKVEQTIYCELDAPQRKLYNELRDHYRQSLLGTAGAIGKRGMNRAKIQILEALLRLRQAACHPGLIDRNLATAPSAKLETLRAQLAEVVAEGHKVLVFSQFTSFLALVKTDLDAAGTVYEYLDGQTRDRQARVERFQTDADCKVFLISLKAGGVGLNLTAAEYVFLLDPWWNPAVEAQAVDRAHRIGQHRTVFAYRLIAKDTVEEKVLELQKAKRALADAILSEDNSVIASMRREDLEMLLT